MSQVLSAASAAVQTQTLSDKVHAAERLKGGQHRQAVLALPATASLLSPHQFILLMKRAKN